VALKDSKRDGHADVINRFDDGVVTDSSVVGEGGDPRGVIEAWRRLTGQADEDD